MKIMYAVPDKIYTLEEYLELDFETDAKYGFFDGELTEISGVTINHNLINGNLFSILHEVLTENFQVWIGSMKLKVPALPSYRYPNLSVSPKKAEFEITGRHSCLVNPILICEIYSPETEIYDCGEKFEAYKSIESFREYLAVDQERKDVTLYTKYDEETWFQSEYVEGESLKLESLECELSVDEIYRRIIFKS